MKYFKFYYLFFVVILLSCGESSKKEDATNTINVVQEDVKERAIAPPLSSINGTFSYKSFADARYNQGNASHERYIAHGEFTEGNNTLMMDIPVSTKDFDLNLTKSYNISTADHNIMLVVLKKDDGTDADTPQSPNRLIYADYKLNDFQFNRLNDQKIKVYVIHDECYEKDKNAITSILQADAGKEKPGVYATSIYNTHRVEIRNLRESCDGIKPLDEFRPKEVDGGILSGGK